MELLKDITESAEKNQGPSQTTSLLKAGGGKVEIFLAKEY